MELIQKIAQAQVLQHYGLHKLARTKFLELAEKGLLSAKDKARLGITQKFTNAVGKQKNRMVRSLRGRLYGAKTDLAPYQLAKNRTVGEMLGDATVARHGATMSNSPMGAAFNAMGNVVMSDDFDDQIKTMAPVPKRHARAAKNIRRSLVDHELAEGAMGAGAAHWARQQGEHGAASSISPSTAAELNKHRDEIRPISEDFANKINLVHPGTEHAYEAKPFASHYGPAALIAEAQSAFRDPAAARFLDKARELDPGEAYTKRKMKQFGHTPAYPMPLGGKQHFALDNAVANMPDEKLAPQARKARVQTPGARVPKGTVAQLEAGLEEIETMERLGMIDAGMANAARTNTQTEIQRAKKSEGGVRQLPYADRQEARRRHMALFAAPRNDANPGRRI